MKKLFFLILACISCFQLKAQDDNQLNDIILSSLKSYISHDMDFRIRRGMEMNTYNYYISTNGLSRSFPFDSLQNVEYYSWENIEGLSKDFKKKLNRGLRTFYVETKLQGERLSIIVHDVEVRRLKKGYTGIGHSDWGIYIYEYSCESNKWDLKETKYGGI